MSDWVISDQDIESTEKLLLPNGAHFNDDARTVIRCWHSTDVSACPGSGKTTVLLAKLKLLADRMPFENGAGICVLSHTNVAVDEIKARLSGYADRLLCYPNYIGTIQSFVDRYVTLPYLRKIAGKNVQAVDNRSYAQHMLNRMQKYGMYRALEYVTKRNYETGGQFSERIEHTQALYISNGALYIERQRRSLAGAGTTSVAQYKALIRDLLKDEGIMRYQDAYLYAETAVRELPESYTDLFSARFKYVFVDEYQDCNLAQRQAIATLFNPEKCSIMRIGDPDQAIYNSADSKTQDWMPNDDFLAIQYSCRYSQEIADVIFSLKRERSRIISSIGVKTIKPIILLFEIEKIDRVLGAFINVLDKYELYDSRGIYKAIGAVRKEDSAGLKIGSYWTDFDGSVKANSGYNYWISINEICTELINGKLYHAEREVRKLLCRVFHYLNIKHPVTGKEFTMVSLKSALDEEYSDVYRRKIFELSRCEAYEVQTVDSFFRQFVKELLKVKYPQVGDVFGLLPGHFLEEPINGGSHNDSKEKNVFIDPIRGRRIVFDTIHGVKGETHDATLYLETDRQGASDLSRILPFYGAGKVGKSTLFDYSRKLAYVGFSRPRTLLCVAMKSETYQKSKGVFDKDWEIIDLRK